MLAKIYRLPAKENFKNSKSLLTEYFRILIKPNSLSHNRFGFVISKKIDKRAVVRNRMRRMLSEAVHTMTATGEGRDMLFIVKKSFEEIPMQEITITVRESLEKLLQQ